MVEVNAIFSGCNCELQVFDYNDQTHRIAYGAGNTVAITTPFSKNLDVRVCQTLKSHTAVVTVVKWLPEHQLLISGAEDGVTNIWKYTDDGTFSIKQTFEEDEEKSSITCINSPAGDEKILIVGRASGAVEVWSMAEDGSEKFSLFGKFEINSEFYPLSVSAIEVRPEQLVVLVAGTKPNLYVYSLDLNNAESITCAAKLEGHEDWIRALAVKQIDEDEFVIASGSQDRWIRLWKLCLNEKIDNSDQDKSKLRLLSNKLYKFTIGGSTRCAVNFDAIIMGHDDWISSLCWHATEMRLLSASADSSIIVWEPDPVSGVWISKVRLGEMAIKGASTATGSSGGFYCSRWIVDEVYGREIVLTNGKTGSFRCWYHENEPKDTSLGPKTAEYLQNASLTGPSGKVTDVEWSKTGEYLLATSLDQTTRLFAQWTKHSREEQAGRCNLDTDKAPWYEFSRPQIHGYDMICVKPITETRFASAGDEKVIRVFDEPKSVADLLLQLTNVAGGNESMPESASLPVLGLSNKADLEDIEEEIEKEADRPESGDELRRSPDESDGPEKHAKTNMLAGLQAPPLEDHLQRYTLWPEKEKLYGHGFEITTLDVSPDGKLIASACRSNSEKHAAIRLFNTDNWQQLDQTLAGHELTITRIRWSPTGEYLLSVSRDRMFSLWQKGEDGQFVRLALQPKAHTRIIWDCCWIPSSISRCMFVTGARDRKIKVWELENAAQTTVSNICTSERFSSAVTALDAYSGSVVKHAILAVGLDNGLVYIYSVDNRGSLKELLQVDPAKTPDGSISRLSFRAPRHEDTGRIYLAVGSADHSVRILSFGVAELGIEGSNDL